MDDKQYYFTLVPPHAKVNLWTVSIVRTGMTTALAQFMLGAMLGHALTYTQAMLATLLGNLLLQGISFGVGLAGYKR
ncbi:hypothetical protein JZM24_00600 [Candidatus Sodalis endolongispinus]|uniref:Uncharacterized protein n=1 Tax=Candidatus Sodalis endolongispinus TaxID=2812662 RepID=A0ABS5Y8I6_9GAMM|nr:hypothetical protein [Candidatus Sodalis endolongispinus]MBT9431042.1 hypothetical protein [Candidatus Sodalis endolongispinus]